MNIGKNLNTLMKNYGVNALDIERLTGVPSSTTYRILKNKAGNPTIEVLKKLANFFQITVSQFIGEETFGCKQIPFIANEKLSRFIEAGHVLNIADSSIPVDIPLSSKCFATHAHDCLMEPYIIKDSIVIVDPDKEFKTKDFALLLKRNQVESKIRQIIKNDDDIYLKVLNNEFPIPLEKYFPEDYSFIGCIVHYRTNLMNFSQPQQPIEDFSNKSKITLVT